MYYIYGIAFYVTYSKLYNLYNIYTVPIPWYSIKLIIFSSNREFVTPPSSFTSNVNSQEPVKRSISVIKLFLARVFRPKKS